MLRKKVSSLEMRVKVLEDRCEELKIKNADCVVQIELLRQSMLDFDRALKSDINDMRLLKVIFSPFNSSRRSDNVGGWCKR